MSTFYICATPIGNLDDISKRLVDTLNSVDIVYAEDTRRGKKLLNHLDIKKPIYSYFVGNEKSKSNDLDSLKIIEDLVVNINKRQFLHNANFAVRNSEFELSPYIALTDLYESKKILDTVYKSLSARNKNSKYAKQLKSIID